MPIPAAVRAILGNVWASTAGALKQDPADADPPIVRADGYPASFSSTLVPEQETIQGRWNEFDSAIDDIYTSGVPFYDALIDYPADAMTNEDGVLYNALIANGPGTSNAIAPSADTAGTTWGQVSGTQGAPSAPAQPTATSPAPGTLDVSWNCPLDGGSVITGFELQYKNAGTSWSTAQDVATTVPFAQLTGLTNGQALEFRVRATNSIDTSPWSATGTGTPTASAPSGGSTLALTARGGDTEAYPHLAGAGHGRGVNHRLPCAVAHQRAGFLKQPAGDRHDGPPTRGPDSRTARQYFFRVRAVNSVGNSTWSNEATATPAVGEQLYTAAGSYTFTWPWSATKAHVLAYGGRGGGGSSPTDQTQSAQGQGDAGWQSSAGSVVAAGGRGGFGLRVNAYTSDAELDSPWRR